jgi:hypothetical protein
MFDGIGQLTHTLLFMMKLDIEAFLTFRVQVSTSFLLLPTLYIC